MLKQNQPLAPHFCVTRNTQANWSSNRYGYAGNVLRVSRSNTKNYVRIYIGDETLDPLSFIELNTLAAEQLIADLQKLLADAQEK